MKSKIIDKSSLANIDLTFLDIDPFSNREALNWLANKASDTVSDKNLSIRHIASIWKWPKSKVARFIKALEEKGLIETETETKKASTILYNSRLSENDKYNMDIASETAIVAKTDSNELKISERDRFGTVIDINQTQQTPCLQQACPSDTGTDSGQNPDGFESKDENALIETEIGTVVGTFIGTDIETTKTSATPCNSRLLEKDQCNTETVIGTEIGTEIGTVIGTKLDSNELKISEWDRFGTAIDVIQVQQAACLQQTCSSDAGTNLGQNPDSVEKKKKKEKKEKNQKKEKEEKEKSLKEKNIPYGDTKKEKVLWSEETLSSIDADEIYSFATSLAMTPSKVEWELAKFTDHLKSSGKKPPRDIPAAFRNWLRKSLEFNELREKNEQINQTRSAPTSFERFLAGAARALAERQRNRLEGRHARKI